MALMCILHESLACMCVWSVITTKKRHGIPVDTTAKEGDGVSFGRPLGTTKEVRFGVSRETCEYHSRGEEYMVIYISERYLVPQQTGGICVCPWEAGLC